MSKVKIAVFAAAVSFSLGVFAADMVLKGHPHLQKAHHACHEALEAITASQKANEKVWADEGGHGKAAKEAIEHASHEIDMAAEWVNSHGK